MGRRALGSVVLVAGCASAPARDAVPPPAEIAAVVGCGDGVSMGTRVDRDVRVAWGVLPDLHLDEPLRAGLEASLARDAFAEARDATDETAWVMPRVTTLLGDGDVLVGHPLERPADRLAWKVSRFMAGCMEAVPYELVVTVHGVARRFRDVPGLAAAVAPIDSPARAVAFVQAVDREVWTPLDARDVGQRLGRGDDPRWASVASDTPWIDVREQSGGWLVKVPKQFFCGCGHDVVQASYWVGRDGAFCEVADPPVLLVRVEDRGCYD